jgi:hypothetical protein
MKRKFILFSLFVLFTCSGVLAQSGGRKKEGRQKKSGLSLKKTKSQGHADEFARGNGGRRSRLSRLIRKDKPAWTYRRSGTASSNYRENRFLFFRFRSKGRQENAEYSERRNKVRARDREHGSDAFHSKKHKRKAK